MRSAYDALGDERCSGTRIEREHEGSLVVYPRREEHPAGVLVSKGGYTARIKAKAPGGTATAIRKIGVIH